MTFLYVLYVCHMTFLAQNNTFVSEIRKYPDRWPDFGTDVEVALKCDRQQCEEAASVDNLK